MKILITNDDGIQVDALEALAEALGEEHQVWVVAPDGNRSGQSMSITLHHHLTVREIKPRWFSCSGTPTDCVLLVALKAVGVIPDLLISGINYGPNLGTDLLYSGTAAAAREGAIKGIPSIAMSLNRMEAPWDFSGPIAFVKEHLERLYSMCGPGYFLNINFPDNLTDESCMKTAFPCHRDYRDNFQAFDPPKGPRYYFPHGNIDVSNPEEGSDLEVVLQGNIAVCPIKAEPQIMSDHIEWNDKLTALEGSCG